jgi:aspartyl-tRNA(Asn)/glutamyl-tRNA(Gln) amidotransferase subunit B
VYFTVKITFILIYPKDIKSPSIILPIGVDGFLEFYSQGVKKRVGIKRVHIEEDTGKLIHEGMSLPPNTSGVDCNRCGIPLAEIVTEPDLSSPEEARDCLMMLRNIVCYLGVSDGNMEEGSLRCDANISLSSSSLLGVKVEVKNMNSFRSVYRALSYEVERQKKLLEEGKPIFQETRHWDEINGVTVSARSKEEAEDYRYFPDPDLLPFSIKEEMIEEIKSELPELPLQREEKFMSEYELSQGEAEILVQDKEIADFFEDTLREFNEPRMVCNWITTEVFKNLKELGITISQSKVTPVHLAELLKMVDKKEISGTIAKNILEEMFATGARAREIITRRGISLISNEKELENIVREVIEKNPQSVADYLSGKEKALQFLIGQVMKETRGQADPEVAKNILIKVLSNEE